MRASSSLRKKKSMLVRVPISAYLFMRPRRLNTCQQQPSETNYVGSSPHHCGVAVATVFFNIYIQGCVVELRPTQHIYGIYKDQLGHAMTHLAEALSAYFFMQPRQLNACQQQPSGKKKNYVGSSPTIGIFHYATHTVERVLAVAFGKKKTMLLRVPLSAYFLCSPDSWIFVGRSVQQLATSHILSS